MKTYVYNAEPAQQKRIHKKVSRKNKIKKSLRFKVRRACPDLAERYPVCNIQYLSSYIGNLGD